MGSIKRLGSADLYSTHHASSSSPTSRSSKSSTLDPYSQDLFDLLGGLKGLGGSADGSLSALGPSGDAVDMLASLIASLLASNPDLLDGIMQALGGPAPVSAPSRSSRPSAPSGGGYPSGGGGGSGSSGQVGGGGGGGGSGVANPVGSSGGASGASSQGGQGGQGGASPSGSARAVNGPSSIPSTGGPYSVEQCMADMRALWDSNGGGVEGHPNQEPDFQTIAEGIVKGINDPANTMFQGKDKPQLGKMLVAMAYKESKFGLTGRDEGGVFQTASNRQADYHATMGPMHFEANTVDSIAASLWCMSNLSPGWHPTEINGMQINYDHVDSIPLTWNYNPGEIDDYMNKVNLFMQAMS